MYIQLWTNQIEQFSHNNLFFIQVKRVNEPINNKEDKEMKKIKATATTTNEVIAEITISDEDKKSAGLSCWLIAMKYMETNFPGMDDWKWKADHLVTCHWLITIYREVKTLIFDEKE